MNDSLRSLGLALLAAAPLLAAPQLPQDPATPPMQSAQEQLLQQLFQPQTDPLDSIWNRPPIVPRRQFTGFPTFPPRLAGYGSYPLDPSAPQATGGRVQPFPMPFPLLPGGALVGAPDEPPGWPAWVTSKQSLPYEPTVALLVQHVDRVWWRGKDEDAFIPLFFHDKFALTQPGCAIHVRQAGAFELLLHETGRLVAHGPTYVELQRLDGETVEIVVREFTRLRLVLSGRAHSYELPDGSRLLVSAPAPDPERVVATVADVVLERMLEPGWLGGRATMTNLGDRDVVWQRTSGALTLRPGERGTFFLQKPTTTIGAALAATGVELVRDGKSLQGTATQAAKVEWCGAAFELPAGVRARLDPLQGDPFAPPKPPAAPATTPPATTAPNGATR